MTKTAYVVLQTEWQYNDEYYYGGLPQKAFLDKKRADDECRINVAKARSSLAQFLGEEGFYRLKDEGLHKRLQIKEGAETWEYRVPETASDDDILMLLALMRMEFYIVKPVVLQ